MICKWIYTAFFNSLPVVLFSLFAGVGFWLTTALMYVYPRLRLVEDELLDILTETD